MNCFYHQTVPAVGTCKSCGKGLCPQCAVDFGTGLACRGHCEEAAKAISDLILQNVARSAVHDKIVTTAWRNRFANASFYLVFGFLLAGFAMYRFAFQGWGEPVLFFGLMSVMFFFFGFLTLWRAMAVPRPPK